MTAQGERTHGGFILITGLDGIRYALRPQSIGIIHDAENAAMKPFCSYAAGTWCVCRAHSTRCLAGLPDGRPRRAGARPGTSDGDRRFSDKGRTGEDTMVYRDSVRAHESCLPRAEAVLPSPSRPAPQSCQRAEAVASTQARQTGGSARRHNLRSACR